MKVALFGGSFNPIHEGHLTIAVEACRKYRFDRFFFVPASCSPFKLDESPVSAAVRIEMIQAALQTRCGAFPFEICTYETDRGGISYSIDTIEYIKRLFPSAEVTWIGGDDLLSGLPRWKAADRLCRETAFLIFRRGGIAEPPVPAGFSVDFLDIPPIPYASSGIRDRIKAGTPAASVPGIPSAVAAVIEREGLYR